MSDSQSQQKEEVKKDTSQQSTKTSSSVENETTGNQNLINNNTPKSPDSSNSTSNSKIKLNPLTPSDYGEYNEILDNVLTNDEYNDVHNIAITADYGEGKSSVINSFLKQNPKIKKKTITVSLSKYNYKDDDTIKWTSKNCNLEEENGGITNGETSNNDYSICEHLHSVENRIEVQIINQILYQIDPKNIYLSKYKIKKNLSKGWRRFFGILAAILIFSIYNLIFCLSQNIKEWSNWTDKLGLWLGWLVVIIPLSILGFFFVFYQQWRRISNIVFNVFGSKIETNYFKNSSFNLSVWDQEWREIIYIISHSQKNYIIFEDLDRLENYEILSKLKDLSLTLNSQKDQKKIKFIYVISDEVFEKEEEKTKFFDLIIPIIPVSNLQNRILIWYKSLDPDNIPDKGLIYSVSKSIFDVRFIKNISNEYNVFLKLNDNFINNPTKIEVLNALFSLIILKNIFTDEFKNFKKCPDLNNLVLVDSKNENRDLFNNLKNVLKKHKNKIDFENLITKDSFSFLNENDIKYIKFLNNKDDSKTFEFSSLELSNVNYLVYEIINEKINYAQFNIKKLLNLDILKYLFLNWEKNNKETLMKIFLHCFQCKNDKDVINIFKNFLEKYINSNGMIKKFSSFIEGANLEFLTQMQEFIQIIEPKSDTISLSGLVEQKVKTINKKIRNVYE